MVTIHVSLWFRQASEVNTLREDDKEAVEPGVPLQTLHALCRTAI